MYRKSRRFKAEWKGNSKIEIEKGEFGVAYWLWRLTRNSGSVFRRGFDFYGELSFSAVIRTCCL